MASINYDFGFLNPNLIRKERININESLIPIDRLFTIFCK